MQLNRGRRGAGLIRLKRKMINFNGTTHIRNHVSGSLSDLFYVVEKVLCTLSFSLIYFREVN